MVKKFTILGKLKKTTLYKQRLKFVGSVLTTTQIALSGFNHHPGHVVVSLDKTLCDDYLCFVALNKQQIQWTRSQKNSQKHWIIGNSKAGADSSNYEVFNAMKSVRIVQQLASDAIRWQEDKYAQQQQKYSEELKILSKLSMIKIKSLFKSKKNCETLNVLDQTIPTLRDVTVFAQDKQTVKF